MNLTGLNWGFFFLLLRIFQSTGLTEFINLLMRKSVDPHVCLKRVWIFELVYFLLGRNLDILLKILKSSLLDQLFKIFCGRTFFFIRLKMFSRPSRSIHCKANINKFGMGKRTYYMNNLFGIQFSKVLCILETINKV